jgi:hypothetical protein
VGWFQRRVHEDVKVRGEELGRRERVIWLEEQERRIK